MRPTRFTVIVLLVLAGWLPGTPGFAAASTAPAGTRTDFSLDTGWRSIADDNDREKYPGFEQPGFDDHTWSPVDVPHNWDRYEGAHQVRHGDRHGFAWYRRTFTVPAGDAVQDRRFFLFFEGVGSYATVWVNGHLVGRHAGGLTTFTLDITNVVAPGANVLAVRADHPNGIRDLPWVCGGSELATGFSEGTQPFGIFRPVHLVVTAPIRIEPFGVHVWNDAPIRAAAVPHVRTEIKNYGATSRTVTVTTRVIDHQGAAVAVSQTDCTLSPGQSTIVPQELPPVVSPHLWSLDDPYLYTVATTLAEASATVDEVDTPFGFRWIEWPKPGGDAHQPFRLNGKPVFINGVADYEHLLGTSHAFTAEQIAARVHQVEAAGFNAFRDAHHPHDLRFQEFWDRDGLLWWPQFGAHIWFDNDAFRANFKALLRDWVKERRNSPSLVLWGLQNESVLPADFARECCDIIRELDPTASVQRPIATCNGGTGTDWDVPQNWSGTYGGDPAAYADDLRREHLVGEYGAWRSLGLHTEGGFDAKGPLSEDRMCSLLETKIRLAESVRDEVCGQFMWPLTTHENPGRTAGDQGEQTRDGFRELDRIGPANNKGLFTLWGEPLDAFYLYRSNYAPAATQPIVYIVSHTWPDRWTTPGIKNGIVVYSNCDEVELFNDDGHRSLGRRTRGPKGTHFQWDNVEIRYNTLLAEGRVDGRIVATDRIQLHHLPAPPGPTDASRATGAEDPTTPLAGRNYLYRVNCGGPDYTDRLGHRWLADRAYTPGDPWGSLSWAADYPDLPPAFGSQRKIYDSVAGTSDGALFQTFRYGRDRLHYVFALPDGDYDVELFFAEPWYGTGGGLDCTGWRLFDVAVDGETRLHNLDLWREAGRAVALKKIVPARVRGGRLDLSFPNVAAGQAVISAIAISSADPSRRPPPPPATLVQNLRVADREHASAYAWCSHLDPGDSFYSDAPGAFATVPADLLDTDWIRTASASRDFNGPELLRFVVSADTDVYVASNTPGRDRLPWLRDWDDTGMELAVSGPSPATFRVFHRAFVAGSDVALGPNAAAASPRGAMYTVLLKRRLPPPPAAIIRDLQVQGATWRAVGRLRNGASVYADRDRDPSWTKLPATLADCDWIQTDSRAVPGVQARFTVTDQVEIYVALDARVTQRPAWLADWIDANQTLVAGGPEGGPYRALKRRFAPGAIVELGENAFLPEGSAARMYSVVVRPVRPASVYSLETPQRLSSETPAKFVEWTVTIGVGDRYGLNFRYATDQPQPVAARLTIIGPDGRPLRTDPLEFSGTPGPATWGVLRTRTGSSLNAGTYKFRVTLTGPGSLSLSSLETE